MIWSSRVVKIWAADDLLNALDLQGNENILDVGCGRGLLLIKAAKRLPYGRVVGIDLWSPVDQGNNTKEATLINAQIEGVLDRVEVTMGTRAISLFYLMAVLMLWSRVKASTISPRVRGDARNQRNGTCAQTRREGCIDGYLFD